MTTKEYLGQAFYLDRRIHVKLEQIEVLNALATRVTASAGDMPGGGSRNLQAMESAAAKLIDLQAEIGRDIAALVDLKARIRTCIRSVQDPECAELLELRYLCMHTWREIAETMHVSEKHIYVMHGRALRSVRISESPEV